MRFEKGYLYRTRKARKMGFSASLKGKLLSFICHRVGAGSLTTEDEELHLPTSFKMLPEYILLLLIHWHFGCKEDNFCFLS